MRLVLGVFLLFSCVTAFALDADRTFAQLHHTAWRAKDGAPSQVSALAQTTDGYLWIGSSRGLFRFDGATFELYTPPKGVTLPSHNTYALLATPDGGLWISFRPNGLGFLNKNGRMTIYTRAEELPSSQVYVMRCDRDGRVWAGTHDGLALRQGSRWIEIGAEWNLPRERIRALFVDRDGGVWVATQTHLFMLPRGAKRFRAMFDELPMLMSVTQGNDGRIWYSQFDRGVRSLDGQTISVPEVEGIHFDRDGALWIASTSDGICRVRFETNGTPIIESLRESDGLFGGSAPNLLEDREGNLWAGSVKGLDRFRHAHFVPVTLPPAVSKLTLAAGDGGELWVGSANEELLTRVLPGDAIEVRNAQQAASVFRAADGTRWWGGPFGLWRARGDGFERFPFPDPREEWPWEVFRDDDDPHALWIGFGDVGLLHFANGKYERRAHPAGLPDVAPAATYHDPQGRIWFGYKGNRVARLERGKLRWFTSANGVDVGRIRVIRGRGPHYWIGGELGLALVRSDRFTNVLLKGGERFGTVSGIIETADGTLWLNEMRGVVRISSDEVKRVLRDPTHAIAFERFDLLDGLPGAPQMNWTVSTAVEGTDGRLWFATDNGLGWIQPSRMRRNTLAPPVSIVSIASGDRQYAPQQTLSFPIGTQSLDIRYTATSLSMPERVTFRYKLEGPDDEGQDEWQDAGTRREAFYTKLKPGSYRFRVIAANNDGVWNDRGATIEIELPPAFYQTRWFMIVLIAIVIALFFVINDLRMRRMAARIQRLHDERLDERMRIAHELHDTLLQGVASASMQLHVVDARLTTESPVKPLVTNVVSLMRRVAEEGRQAVQNLRPGGNGASLEDALARVKQELAVSDGARFHVTVTGRSRELHPLIRDEIYRIAREALMNAFRHASAQSIEAELDYAAQLTLRVRDDGRGIEEEVLRSGRDGHWGLVGMRERAQRIGAKLRIASRAGAGTELELIVPGTAYLAGSRRRI